MNCLKLSMSHAGSLSSFGNESSCLISRQIIDIRTYRPSRTIIAHTKTVTASTIGSGVEM